MVFKGIMSIIFVTIIIVLLGLLLVFYVVKEAQIKDKDLMIKDTGIEILDLQNNIAKLELDKNGLLIEINDTNNKLLSVTNKNKIMSDYLVDSMKANEEYDLLSNSLNDLNETKDYATCMAKLEKEKSLTILANKSDELLLYFLKKINDNSTCFKSVTQLESKFKELIDYRSQYDDYYENWCSGYHKVDYYEGWIEKYNTPLDVSSEKLTNALNSVSQVKSNAYISCLS